MIVELDRLMIQGKSLELIIEEEIDSFLSQLESETLQEGDVIIDQFIIILCDVKVSAADQFI
jgi:hypothetical protein